MGVISPVSLSQCRCPEPTTVQPRGVKFSGDRVGEGEGRWGWGVHCPAQTSSSRDFLASPWSPGKLPTFFFQVKPAISGPTEL